MGVAGRWVCLDAEEEQISTNCHWNVTGRCGSILINLQLNTSILFCLYFKVLDIPLTVKMRTGVYDKNWNAHKLIPELREWGASLVTVN